MDGSLEELVEDRGFLPRTSELLVKTRPDWMSIPMFISEDIAGKEFLKLKAVVELSDIETMENGVLYSSSVK